MAKKASQNRLLIPIDLWKEANFDNYPPESFGFFIKDNSVVIICNKELAQKFNYQFLGNCNFSDKHRFYIPKNVDNYLGKGDNYCFTSYLTSSFIYIFKVNDELIKTQTDFYQKLF